MATPISTPEADAGIEAARAALTAAMTGKTPAPAPPAAGAAPAPVAAPAPAPVSAPATEPPAVPATLVTAPATPSPAPVQPVPPTAAGQPVPPITDPAAQRFLEMHGGNLDAALAAALRYNNRLAALAKANPDAFKPGAPADPSQVLPPEQSTPFVDPSAPPLTVAPALPTETASAAVGPEPTLNWEQVLADVDQQVQGDADCQNLINGWKANTTAITQAREEAQGKAARISYLDSLLKDAAVELPELKREELSDERRSLQLDLNMLRQDVMTRSMVNRDIDTQFRERRRQIVDDVSSTYRTKAQEEATQAELTRLETTEEQRLTVQWPAAVQAAMTAHGIPAELAQDFADYAKRAVYASRATNPAFVVEDVTGFVHGVAPRFLKTVDTYHRVQAARYAAAANTRAATPAPVPAPGTPPAPAPSPATQTPEQIMEGIGRELAQRLRR